MQGNGAAPRPKDVKKTCLAALLFLASCTAALPPPAPPAPPPSKEEVIKILEALENSFYDHWGAVEKTADFGRLGAAHVPVLRELADANGDHALMAFRVLARLAPREEFSREARGFLYASAMARERDFVRWGVISEDNLLPAVYGQELLSLGAAAEAPLRRLLTDHRSAPVNGNIRLRDDRVCDYAWVFLAKILGRPFKYDPNPYNRDPQIRAMDLWFDRRR